MAMRWLTLAQKVRYAGVALVFCTVVLSIHSANSPPIEVINRADLQFFAPVGVSNYITSDPVRTIVGTAPAPVVSFRNASYDTVISMSGLEDRLFVQVAAPSCNTNPRVTMTNIVVLHSERTGDWETVMAIETAPG